LRYFRASLIFALLRPVLSRAASLARQILSARFPSMQSAWLHADRRACLAIARART
jgi:hypothetical protein